ncbi:hypothetical protein IAQ61_001912 [Plenodomus lingam]|uniref:uncharacterized protein n=1 Tax=Leptosphaeria maculans TaxID=5022 RepID=UPI00332CC048|nr:hypothetical protein IAQ61_001912 [Plenodomus lingam]
MNTSKCLRLLARQTTHSATTPLRPTLPHTPFSQRSPLQRPFSALAPRRPTLSQTLPHTLLPPPGTLSTTPPATLDLAGKISAHPGLGSIQIRCGPRDTYNPSHVVRKRRHGFLSRIRTKKGRKMIMRRLKKGRWNICH